MQADIKTKAQDILATFQPQGIFPARCDRALLRADARLFSAPPLSTSDTPRPNGISLLNGTQNQTKVPRPTRHKYEVPRTPSAPVGGRWRRSLGLLFPRIRYSSPSFDSVISKCARLLWRFIITDMRRFRISPLIALLLISIAIPLASLYSAPADVLLDTMQHELHRVPLPPLSPKTDPNPYYLSYSVADANSATIVGTSGSLIVSSEVHRRVADVMMRVGASGLDNTHGQSRASGIISGCSSPERRSGCDCPCAVAIDRPANTSRPSSAFAEGEDKSGRAIRRRRQVPRFLERNVSKLTSIEAQPQIPFMSRKALGRPDPASYPAGFLASIPNVL